jgi:TldD protein
MKLIALAAAIPALAGAVLLVEPAPASSRAPVPGPLYTAERPELAPVRAADVVMQALEAELHRSVTGLAEKAERAPYYLGYAVWDRETELITAGYGSILIDRSARQRLLDVDARVGDYRFDNTRRLQGTSAAAAPPTAPLPLPIDDDVAALRAAIWQRTDRALRAAAERLIQVEANRAATTAAADTSADFSREAPYTLIEDVPPAPAFDREAWRARLRRVSARFDEHDEIDRASVQLSATREVRYLVTSEGTRVRTGAIGIRLVIAANTRADDGMDLSLSRTFEATSPDELPAERTLVAATDSLIHELIALRAAPEVEPFTGPAILSGRASAVFFHEIFGHRIEGHRQKDESFAQTFTNRVGEVVLPSFLSVTDDPTQRAFQDIALAGHYRVDDEGVPPRAVTLIEEGVLRGFVMGRSPIQAMPNSTGHGRRQPGYAAVARQGNLMVTSAQTLSPEQLRARLIEEIRRQNKPYGLRIEEIQGGFTFTGRITPQSFKVIPLKVYRVYADGRPDELVRGVDMVGTPLTVFGKILATDDRPEVFNGMCGAESGSVPVSAVSPAILIEEVEIEKKATSSVPRPLLPPPSGERRGGATGAGAQASDVILDALTDELRRSMDSLHVEGLARPHFMAYRVDDSMNLIVDAAFGAVLADNVTRTRRLAVDIRAGTPALDNTNFLEAAQLGGWTEIGFDDSYSAIRRFAWRITDGRYRPVAQKSARKEAALRGLPAPETASFWPDTARTLIAPAVTLAVEPAHWSRLARELSAVFRDYPAIEDSRVRVNVRHQNLYVVTSEGTRARTPETVYMVLVMAIARGPGGTIRDYRVFATPSEQALPPGDELLAATHALAREVTARAAATTLDNYTGPVLIEGRAAPQFFHALFGRFVAGTAIPVASQQLAASADAQRRSEPLFGQRLLPANINIYDDPTLTEYQGQPLLGRYLIDDEGSQPRRVDLAVNGTLRGFLFSRIPGRHGTGSTGHARETNLSDPAPGIGNLIIETSAPVSEDELRRELIRLAREEGHDFGIIVRSFEDAGFVPSRPGAPRPRSELPPALAVYKLHADGREEPLRDVEFADATLRALRDIVAAGGRTTVYNLLHTGSNAPLRFGTTPVSIAAPAVLVRELQLQKSESTEKAPVLRHPYFEGR